MFLETAEVLFTCIHCSDRICLAFQVELLAAITAIEIDWDRGWNLSWLESDLLILFLSSVSLHAGPLEDKSSLN